eukprot:GEMP01024139.1.p1 GENE.GEMP01024139.1~~GEMP01024139.1.p1  ORF type:complete len:579 (+),score=110.67 GEMP01024139.1:123-1859(+)
MSRRRLFSSCRASALAAVAVTGASTSYCEPVCSPFQDDNSKPVFKRFDTRRGPMPATTHRFEPTKVQDTGCMAADSVSNSPYADAVVTWKGGVFDMTTFMDSHPGGAGRINMVQGQDLKPFWKVYELHQRPHILNLLEHYRIGNLTPEDAKRAEDESQFANYYDADPQRVATVRDGFGIPSLRPWNSEPPRDKLVESFYTPNEIFFVRNHNSVPVIDEESFELEVEENPNIKLSGKTYTLQDLKTKFVRREVDAALQCAGNRQEDFVVEDRPLYVAPHWKGAAIGCAKWAGVRVRDILEDCGLDVDAIALGKKVDPECRIVNFVGHDADETGTPYAGVLPAEKVIDPFGDAILAYEMNGETLPRDHGYPLRLLAPGHAGCRNVKWVKQIIVSAMPSELDSGSKLDRHFEPGVSFMGHLRFGDEHVRLEMGPVIQTMPVNSIICKPFKGQVVTLQDEKYLLVQGIAYSGGGRGVCRVEVSVDGGRIFEAAELWGLKPDVPAEAGQGRNWCWVQFEKKIEMPPSIVAQLKQGMEVTIEIVARAIDGDFNSQPEKMESCYNSLGICVNHWDRVTVQIALPS